MYVFFRDKKGVGIGMSEGKEYPYASREDFSYKRGYREAMEEVAKALREEIDGMIAESQISIQTANKHFSELIANNVAASELSFQWKLQDFRDRFAKKLKIDLGGN